MTGLPGKVEKIIVIPNQIGHAVRIADIGDVHLQTIFKAVDIEKIAAVFFDQAVNNGYLCVELNQLAGQIRADESEASSNEDLLPPELIRHVYLFRHKNVAVQLGSFRISLTS